ncbi:lysozyme family protein [Enterococcus termitis]
MKKYFSLFLVFLAGLGTFILLISGGKVNEPETNTEIVAVGLPEAVLQYKEIVEKEAKANNIPDKVNVLLAIMAVESGGKGNDVMQSSESLGLPVNTLQPLESIKQGVKYYAENLKAAKENGCDDDVAIAMYNFGGGYLDFVVKNGKKHTLAVAEKFSREVVAPSLGNTTGEKYHYPNPIANNHGNYLYWNGGNFYYVDLVKQFLNNPSSGSSGASSIAILDSVLGQKLFTGQCYSMTGYYVQKVGGPQLIGSGYLFASKIGSDYDWESYGWEVIFNPKYEQLKAGDVINWNQDPIVAPTIWGHTGVIKSVDGGNNFTTYEQNGGKVKLSLSINKFGVRPFQVL